MLGFYGMLDEKMYTDAVEFIKASRNSKENIPKEQIGIIMNKLSIEQLENNLFTKREMKMLDNIDEFEKKKFYKLKYKESELEDLDWD